MPSQLVSQSTSSTAASHPDVEEWVFLLLKVPKFSSIFPNFTRFQTRGLIFDKNLLVVAVGFRTTPTPAPLQRPFPPVGIPREMRGERAGARACACARRHSDLGGLCGLNWSLRKWIHLSSESSFRAASIPGPGDPSHLCDLEKGSSHGYPDRRIERVFEIKDSMQPYEACH